MGGATKLSQSAMWWESEARWGIVRHQINGEYLDYIYNDNHESSDDDLIQMEAIDGIFMATQYDLYWREDLFYDWHFYDASQSFEFRKNNYKVVVPRNIDNPWILHDVGIDKLLGKGFYDSLEVFQNEYMTKVSK